MIFPFIKKKKKQEENEVVERVDEKLKLLRKIKEEQRKQFLREHRRTNLKYYLDKAGLTLESHKISTIIFNICIIINLIISFYYIYLFSTTLKYDVMYLLFIIGFLWIVVFFIILFILWLLFYLMIDLRIFKRKIGIEEVLADFLQLTSANVRAGMSIDKALWYAVRPQFGILANEIETVAKETMSGEDLEAALKRFADKYDSQILKRSVNLLIEGIAAGGEIGELLDKIANDIKEIQILRKDMAANVTTYVIFISFATLIAAPILFSLSYQLLNIITEVMSGVDLPQGVTTGITINFSEVGITLMDFKIFSVLCLLITSYFSSIIIATIKKGEIKAGFKYIPTFMSITLLLFFFFIWVFEKTFGSII